MNIVKELRERAGMQQKELALLAGVSRPTVSDWEHGKKNPSGERLRKLAEIFGVDVGTILGYEPTMIPMNRDAVPIIGTIACGEAILADENIDGYTDLPKGVTADFALRCQGDSMVPTFYDGDLVLVRKQSDVNDGRIAAVRIGEEATLKRIHHLPDGIILIPDNNAEYAPQILRGEETEDVEIMGTAVGFVRMMDGEGGRVR